MVRALSTNYLVHLYSTGETLNLSRVALTVVKLPGLHCRWLCAGWGCSGSASPLARRNGKQVWNWSSACPTGELRRRFLSSPCSWSPGISWMLRIGSWARVGSSPTFHKFTTKSSACTLLPTLCAIRDASQARASFLGTCWIAEKMNHVLQLLT